MPQTDRPSITPAAEWGPPDTSAGLIQRLFRLHHLMMRVGDRLTSPIGVTSSRWMVLCVLGKAEGPMTVAEIADELLQSAQNVSRMVASMEREGLVQRHTRAGAGRSVFVELTDAGRKADEATRVLGERFGERFTRDVEGDRVSAMNADLDHLIDNVAAYEQELMDGSES